MNTQENILNLIKGSSIIIDRFIEKSKEIAINLNPANDLNTSKKTTRDKMIKILSKRQG